jgi:hypothetical protein
VTTSLSNPPSRNSSSFSTPVDIFFTFINL